MLRGVAYILLVPIKRKERKKAHQIDNKQFLIPHCLFSSKRSRVLKKPSLKQNNNITPR